MIYLRGSALFPPLLFDPDLPSALYSEFSTLSMNFRPAVPFQSFRPPTPPPPLCRPHLPSSTSFVLFKLSSSLGALSSLPVVCHLSADPNLRLPSIGASELVFTYLLHSRSEQEPKPTTSDKKLQNNSA